MSSLSDKIGAIRENPEVVSISEVYREARQVYYDILAAMGRIAEPQFDVASSAESPITLHASASTMD